MANSRGIKYALAFVVFIWASGCLSQTKIRTDSNYVEINNQFLSPPIDSSDIHGILGKSHSVKYIADIIFFWHDLGIFARISNQSDQIDGIGITYSRKNPEPLDKGKFNLELIKTKKRFTGEFEILNSILNSETTSETLLKLGFTKDFFPNDYSLKMGNLKITAHFGKANLLGVYMSLTE